MPQVVKMLAHIVPVFLESVPTAQVHNLLIKHISLKDFKVPPFAKRVLNIKY